MQLIFAYFWGVEYKLPTFFYVFKIKISKILFFNMYTVVCLLSLKNPCDRLNLPNTCSFLNMRQYMEHLLGIHSVTYFFCCHLKRMKSYKFSNRYVKTLYPMISNCETLIGTWVLQHLSQLLLLIKEIIHFLLYFLITTNNKWKQPKVIGLGRHNKQCQNKICTYHPNTTMNYFAFCQETSWFN